MTKVIVATKETSGQPEFAGWWWVPLQYVLGLQKLEVESFWVDHQSFIDPLKHPHSLDYLMRRFDRTARDFELQNRYCIVYNGGERYFGMTQKEYLQLASEADLLINLGGYLPPASPLIDIPRRAYIDVDPGFTHIWAHTKDIGLDRHNFFFTVGQNVGRPEFEIPTMDIEWQPILPPVVLDLWPPHIDENCERFSTVADWRGSQDAIFEAQYYGTKREEFVRLLRVPMDANQRIELALCIGQHDYEDLGLLLGHNWRVRDPYMYAGDLQSYREFIQYSRAEFSVAKSGYVKSNSGWISDRTACYLASGKPALVQSTGFEWRLSTDNGLLTFRGIEEAIKGIETINENYLLHCHAARQIAEEHFNSDIVLNFILQQVGF
ncbi:hypothetical protein N9219_00690 [bacterium]|nr:hypothetical protein [bacterium]